MKHYAPIRRCRHARHPRPMVDECAVGVDIEALCGKFGEFGRHYRLPCHDSTSPGIEKCSCDKRDLLTDAEVAEQEREREADTAEAVRRLNLTLPLIERIKDGTRQSGSEPCPVCNTGTLNWSMAMGNRHVRARCTTKDCLAFME